jgi:dipeptidyl aminopeptidase/acylaminoacyl peptidase
VPSSFDILNDDFEHPQLFAAMGYGVLLASMPVSDERQASSFDQLTSGVLPLLDTIIARGIADSARIAILGQSSGGYAVLGLIAQTNRFRSAIASAAYSDIASDYGTFYGEYRYGDAGSPQRAQILRMLQHERGVVGAPGPPWEHPEWYRANSPLSYVSRVRTPVMLIKGDADFVPLQDAEQFFTALYRQDKRVVLVRYAGEGHTIAARANVLDLWRRFEAWLRETMPPS